MRFFHMTEFECHCKCGRAEMQPAFLEKLDELRARYGKAMIITSGYRCPSHNAMVSNTGQTGPHTTGRAVDVKVDRKDAYMLLGHAIALGFSGVGVKQKGNARFLHLDTLPDAPGQPRPTIWSY